MRATRAYDRVMRTLATGIALAALACVLGCNSPRSHYAVLYSGPQRPAGNLALGPNAWDNRFAETQASRSTWPSINHGYRFNEITSYSQTIFDDQSFYDRLGGGYFQGGQSVRSGVMVR